MCLKKKKCKTTSRGIRDIYRERNEASIQGYGDGQTTQQTRIQTPETELLAQKDVSVIEGWGKGDMGNDPVRTPSSKDGTPSKTNLSKVFILASHPSKTTENNGEI